MSVEREQWIGRAACQGVTDEEVFFPTKTPGNHSGGMYARARGYCRPCPVRESCLADVMANERPAYRHGYVGGKTPKERDFLHRARRNTAARESGAA